jgi:hypothetical protein
VEATLWFVLAVTGFGLLRAVGHVGHYLVAQVLVRVAAFSFVGAGLIGASGWLGQVMAQAVAGVNAAAAQAGVMALGTGAVWVVWLLASVAWVLTILPTRWFAAEIPDWLSIGGLVLPSLAASIPGRLGEVLNGLITAAGTLRVDLVRQAVS